MNEKYLELPEEKRANLMNGAMETFAGLGYKKASTADIAASCGVSKSLLFHYFGTKKELFSYVYHYSTGMLAERLEPFHYEEREDLFDMIRRANRIRIDLFRSHPYLYQFLYQAYFEEDPDVQEIVRAKNEAVIPDTLSTVIRHMDRSKLKEGVTPEKACQIILWVSEGFLQNKLRAKETDPDKLLPDFEEWMDTLKRCMYKEV